MGDLSEIPHGWYLCDGNNGTPDLQNKFLQSYGNYSINTSISAGLPNIKGNMHGKILDNIWGSDAIRTYPIGEITSVMWQTRDPYTTQGGFTFDASLSNPIYGNSTTVQPPAYIVYFIIRVK